MRGGPSNAFLWRLLFALVVLYGLACFGPLFGASVTGGTNLVATAGNAVSQTFQVNAGGEIRYTVINLASPGVPYSLAAVTLEVWRVASVADGELAATLTGRVVDASAGKSRVSWRPSSAVATGLYEAILTAYQLGAETVLARDHINVEPVLSSGGGGGGGDVSVTITGPLASVTTAPGPTSINGASTGGVTIAAGGLGLRVTTNGNIITVTNDLPIPTAPAGVPLTLQFIPTNQSYAWAPIGIFDGIPSSGVGTNISAFVYVGRQWQQFTTPAGITQLEFYANGGGGAGSGNSGNSGGFVYMLVPTTPGTIYDIAVAEGGDSAVAASMAVMTNAWIGGGARTGQTHIAYGGGGASVVRLASSTNYLLVAPGGGASSIGGGTYGVGGGKDGGAGFTTNAPTNMVVGAGATAADFYGSGSAGGVNASNALCDGSFLQAGTCIVMIPSNNLLQVFYPGGGWHGGAGTVVYSTNGIPSGLQMSASGGNAYINPAYGWGYSERGGPTYQYTGGMEFSWYLSPAGLGGANADGNHGRVVVRY